MRCNSPAARAGVARPGVDGGVGAEPLQDDELVVGWLHTIRLGDRGLAGERADRNPDELEDRVVIQRLQQPRPVAGPYALVEP